ncbi:membrane hypothetical protein [Vibrio crassostreae]|uniref:hypothetical protein n=1 Tax=Vibrio crassostreae TaxID=246167 RepID=UPI000F462020|nr:hypothetical protein [Vibrio crassostreae]ROR05805.1 hypothetical protein EDB36_12217 [Vibrio crassostreae]CAK2012910.1 membrane hypothetical protein [Vibrio crassostreae]CAK2330254.1 membrane hypothetical protein [Vibrio crassostreae]CAK2347198.1 membrane hypothetical protein [Vibrio crassostreae]CAK3330363.1 membrane hypothetical protein [Vibrio crassostreae]
MTHRSIFMPDEQRQLVASHNTFSNDVVGVFAFSMGVASLASNHATNLATVSFIFCCIWMLYKGVLIYSTLKRAYVGVPCWKQAIDGILENFIYLIGLGFVGLIAFEVVTVQTFQSWSLAEMFNLTMKQLTIC